MSRADVVYLVSRFPVTSETFIVRELDALDRTGRFDLELRSLFPSPDTLVHDIARRWDARLIRPSAAAGLAGFGWAAATRPSALASVLSAVISGYSRRPKLMARALVTVVLACAHARDLARRAEAPIVHAHFATYPVELIEPCILAGCRPGGVVLDPFGGAGTTALAAAGLGRSAILIEVNPDYAAMAQKRLKASLVAVAGASEADDHSGMPLFAEDRP